MHCTPTPRAGVSPSAEPKGAEWEHHASPRKGGAGCFLLNNNNQAFYQRFRSSNSFSNQQTKILDSRGDPFSSRNTTEFKVVYTRKKKKKGLLTHSWEVQVDSVEAKGLKQCHQSSFSISPLCSLQCVGLILPNLREGASI